MIKFVEKTHRYLTAEDKELISVSKFTEQFKQKIDWKTIAANVAKKETKAGNPMTTTQVLKKWETKRIVSSQIGTLYHTIREDELLSEVNPAFYDNICEKKACPYINSEKWSLPINELENNTVYPELMIYSMDHMLCGQSDKVIVTNNTINIWDYKTDAEITFRGFSNKWVKPKKLLAPLNHLDECNGNLYSIKMSLYMYMLWKANKGRLKVGDLIIEHVHLKRDPDNDNIPVLENGKPVVLKIEQIKLPYRRKEVEEMLKFLKDEG